MHCPFCGSNDTKVTDSRLADAGNSVKRRRKCHQCKERFTTFETAALQMPRIIKHNGNREPFELRKLETGILRALEKRPVATKDIDHAIQRILQKIRGWGERECAASVVGDWVMDELRKMDKVAYIRFASVYRSFQDLDEFRQTIDNLEKSTEDISHD